MKVKKSKVNIITKTKKADRLDFNIQKISDDILSTFIKTEKLKGIYTVDVTLTTNASIKKINKENRDIDKETDVLSFPMMCDDLDTGSIFLGDVIISVDKVLSQSKLYGHSIKREYSFLLCHSLLHLIGYDHMTKKDEAKMIKRQNLILDNLNIKR
ncbi:MAG: rRNA maturation RNase YbeY [Lachnospiraceae bacterium]|nr:rRNA maturation RNase YbeY [Lachnospiraceae bacterium]